MSRTMFKKSIRTVFSGQCKGGLSWSERVRTTKAANKIYRKGNKINGTF